MTRLLLPLACVALALGASGPAPQVAQHMILLQPLEDQLVVRESLIVKNGGSSEWRDPANGAVRVYVPEEAAGTLGVAVLPPGGASREEKVRRTNQKGVYQVDYALPPGETRFDFSYSLPFKTPGSFSGRILHAEGGVNLVVPPGIGVAGEGIAFLGAEPRSKFSIYGVETRNYKVELQAAASPPPAAEEESAGSSLDQILPKVYDNVYGIIGLALAALALGFVMFFRMDAAPKAAEAPGGRARR